MNSVPIASRTAAANGQYPTVIFDRAQLDVVFIVFHGGGKLIGGPRPPLQQMNYLTERNQDKELIFSPSASLLLAPSSQQAGRRDGREVDLSRVRRRRRIL